jgi:hypothetical protein
MKQILILLIGITFLSCHQSTKESSGSKTSESIMESEGFDWLLGNWKRLNEEAGKETFENWEKTSDSEYLGIGFSMQDGDTIKQENIRLIKAGENWDLIVKVPEETQAVKFKGISHHESAFTCENNEIDFPNKIKYWKSGDRLKASVSNAEMEIPFEFEKITK